VTQLFPVTTFADRTVGLFARVPLDVATAIDHLAEESSESVDVIVETLLRTALIVHDRMAANRAELVEA